jgi:nicotinate-nucleotide adenylyltransferase
MPGIGVLGGSFNPVHLAHMFVAERVREELALDRVLLVPVARQPLKLDMTLAPATDRLAMLELATAGNPALRPDPIELARGGVSYMADTLAEIGRRAGAAPLYLILGSDAYRLLPRWRRLEEIRRLSRIVVVPRPGDGEPAPPEASGGAIADTARARTAPGDLFVDVPTLDISASDIRARVAGGASIRYLVPEGVREYIESHALYRIAGGESKPEPAIPAERSATEPGR